MRIVITGADGFVGRNLRLRLAELGHTEVFGITRATPAAEASAALHGSDFVFHLAGVNRPQTEAEFETGNIQYTKSLCAELAATGRPIPVVFTSSIQSDLENAYGRSKRGAEQVLREYAVATGSASYIFQLPNVFGKWSRPFYNTAVATFCHQIARGLPITVNNPAAPLRLVFIDDVVAAFIALLGHGSHAAGVTLPLVSPVFETTVGFVADTLHEFRRSRETLMSPPVGTNLVRALYSTYLSFLPVEAFEYQVPAYRDPRGEFVEMLKTPDCGQFSYFTAHPGITRGEHYHHTKTEKFLIVTGTAHFGFRHLQTDERYELTVPGGEGRIVETAPGWVHKVTNIGEDLLVVMLWVNEIFDRQAPDTVAVKVDS